ncbi:MAG: ribosome silencing factor [Thiomonas sp.]|uniref:ribosome silencing factor n=1 Tax=Thiomonas sp. TaxID=2047785 RepID=UPI002A36AE61|nr:ribosome silencing factor [Thiomonas sp.]MDY0329667.1 ribosome silencing factor [Thiomonas sp.]
MDIRKLQRTIVDALEDVKAQDIEVFNTEELTSLFDRVVVASGTSNRQTRALASSVRDSVKAAGFEVRNPEGEETGEWVLVDCGAAVVHIMQPAIRAYYKLEELWGAKPVHLKLGAARRAGPKAAVRVEAKGPDSRPDPAETQAKAPARKTAASKTATRKHPAAKKAAAKTTRARTSPYGETAAEKKRVTRVVGTAAGARSAPAAPARKRAQPAEAPVAAKRPAARKAAPTAAKRPAAKKSASPAPAKRVAARKRAS